MQIAKDSVVTIDYKLTDSEGTLLEESGNEEEFAYLHGHGQLLDPLEQALEGKEKGDRVQISISTEEGFGERDEALVVTVPRDRFPDDEDLVTGLQVEAETDQGHQIFTIMSVADDSVTLDGNHPYAGYALDFDVTVQAVREASPEEIEHEHAHNGEHHQH